MDFNSPETFESLFASAKAQTFKVLFTLDDASWSLTIDRLQIYHDLLVYWQKSKNLIASGTLNSIWHRHFADSAQLLFYARADQHWVDLGAGAGFPGLVIAAFQKTLVEHDPSMAQTTSMTLVEANHRKCAFLREAVREMGLTVDIVNSRIESFAHKDTIQPIDLVTARALANLSDLLSLSSPLLKKGASALFLKGKEVEQEIEAARKNWAFEVDLAPSMTDETGRITYIYNVSLPPN